eukprot:TRINITY_DN5146_c0_g1_i2.p1 TRINITY_DN5146_c0_g1~~TRINITY_DN5146_c0_g1_i2.p1  ORF type:complete len:239 (-),score=55.35 TRINITY_DN5146_c0_g1_i2:9-725(-)
MLGLIGLSQGIAALFLYFYKIDESTHKRMVEVIRERKRGDIPPRNLVQSAKGTRRSGAIARSSDGGPNESLLTGPHTYGADGLRGEYEPKHLHDDHDDHFDRPPHQHRLDIPEMEDALVCIDPVSGDDIGPALTAHERQTQHTLNHFLPFELDILDRFGKSAFLVTISFHASAAVAVLVSLVVAIVLSGFDSVAFAILLTAVVMIAIYVVMLLWRFGAVGKVLKLKRHSGYDIIHNDE